MTKPHMCQIHLFLQETQTNKQLRRWAGGTNLIICNFRDQMQNLICSKKCYRRHTKKHQLAKYISFTLSLKKLQKLHI